MKTILLTQNKQAIVDDKYYHILSKYKWYAHKRINGKNYYAETKIKDSQHNKYRNMKMHRLIMELEGINIKGQLIDHKNQNSLDNRVDNLRLVNISQNLQNASKHKDAKHSIYKGVFPIKLKNKTKYRASIFIDSKVTHLGHFDNEIDAAKMYDKVAIQYFGEYASINFPQENIE